MERVCERVDEIAKKMGITQEIMIYASEKQRHTPVSIHGSKISQTAIQICFNARSLNLSEDAIDFVIAHEFSHIANYDHMIVSVILSATILAIDTMAFFYFSIFAIPFIECLGTYLQTIILRSREKNADLHAMTVLGSNEGAIEWFDDAIAHCLEKRKKTEDDFKHNPEEYFNNAPDFFSRVIRKLFYYYSHDVIACGISPEGDNRKDLTHPPLLKRKEQAMEFYPKSDMNDQQILVE